MGRCLCGRQPFVAFSGRSRRVRIARSHSHEVFRRAVDVDDFDLPVAVDGEAGPLKCMRRDRDRGALHVDHPCEEFRDRRPCSARRTNPARATGAIRRVRRIVRSRSPGLHQRGCSCSPYVFVMGCTARRRAWPVRWFCDAGRAMSAPPAAKTWNTRLGGRDTPGSKAADRTLASMRARRVAGRPGIKIPGPMAPGCGTGLIHCGGQTGRQFAAEMRYCTDSQGKTACAIVWKVAFPLAGMADKAH